MQGSRPTKNPAGLNAGNRQRRPIVGLVADDDLTLQQDVDVNRELTLLNRVITATTSDMLPSEILEVVRSLGYVRAPA